MIAVDDPRAEDIRQLLQRHLDFAHAHSPREDVHALDTDALVEPSVTFFSARRDGELLAVGALRLIDAEHGEVKSMHTAEAARGQGLARAMLEHLIAEARSRGVRRLSLETGSMEAFAPARNLYASAGFTVCEPFGGYHYSPNSTCMTLVVEG